MNTILKKQLTELQTYSGQNTELISVYIAAGEDVANTRERLHSEYHDAENIQSKSTRNNVQKALSWLRSRLLESTDTVSQGIALFAGVTEENGFVTQIIQPDEFSIPHNTYHCDKQFLVQPLLEIAQDNEKYGLALIERGETAIGTATGSQISLIHSEQSNVMSKHSAGGFSQKRFERERERQKNEFFKSVANRINQQFLDHTSQPTVSKLLIGGTAGSAQDFINTGEIHHELEKRIVGPYSIQYANKNGLQELFEMAKNDLPSKSNTDTKLEKFFNALREDSTPITYGSSIDYANYAELGAIDTLFITEEMLSGIDDETIAEVEQNGGIIVTIDGTTPKQNQFRQGFTIGAILRFPVSN